MERAKKVRQYTIWMECSPGKLHGTPLPPIPNICDRGLFADEVEGIDWAMARCKSIANGFRETREPARVYYTVEEQHQMFEVTQEEIDRERKMLEDAGY